MAWSKAPCARSSCRDPDVVRGFGALAYAANMDATIQYFGHNFFLITSGKGTRIVTDPLGPGWYPNPNVVGDVVTVGKEMFNHNAVQIVLGHPLILRGLKNYGADWNKVSTTFKDTLIYNVPIHQNAEFIEGIHGSAFVFDVGVLCIAHLGDLSQKLNEQQIKSFGKVDVALTPTARKWISLPTCPLRAGVSACAKNWLPRYIAPWHSRKICRYRSQPPPTSRSIANSAPHSAPLLHFTKRIAAAAVLLRGLVQHVPSTMLRTGLSLCRHLGDFPGT
ncbi:MAG: MBL fold metallo-hydrolase [Deltaproteobacteria bacterium]|nr:MBL fold metallo-hydrolase [Deltaproteobacteria bacterium]